MSKTLLEVVKRAGLLEPGPAPEAPTPPAERTTQIRLTRTTADMLRALSARLGFLQTRGIMAGELGSIAQLCEALVRAERAAPADETARFERLLAAYLEWGTPAPDEDST